ncbi:hydroxypyruvate isomerase family protein [Pseudonocardia broussonetiae]|uniref:TIM barrel protein n=1 Tax=Pseudonocardia broussonetiae TaxID=2736640 RepID=A0A6M6JMK4_9PSEU|nr:TIM barrel protein [Pseudonocardia broussonetiae]QJY48177.1 TIM barrel protein [Pseudonocardia broussonetiae]
MAIHYAVNCSILFTELPLLQRPAAAAAAGFDAVEFWWPFPTTAPTDAEVDEFASAVEDAGVRLTGLNFAAGDMPAGDRGLVSWPGREAGFRDSVAVAVGLGERLGTRVFNALYGNRVEGAAGQDDVADANLAHAAGAAARIGATVVLEPLSGAERYPLRTAADALAVADRVGEPNLALLADLYHLAVNGEDLDALPALAARIGHVQIADAPGRHEPGTGSLDLRRHLDALTDAGYTGHVGLEYAPTTTSAAAFDWLAPSHTRELTS